MSDFIGLISTYPISTSQYRNAGRTVAQTAYRRPRTAINAPPRQTGAGPRALGATGSFSGFRWGAS